MKTGSTLGDAAGFNCLSTRRALYVHFGKSLPPTSVEVQKAMSHGTKKLTECCCNNMHQNSSSIFSSAGSWGL